MTHKLLLADDSVTIQRVIELTFADEDVQVIAVGDGRQAIERIESDRPDIVLADIGMPERDGYEVAAFVKNTPHLAHIPVLLLTGAFEPIDEQRASRVGCDGVLAKPFEPHMVITRVKELLAGAPPARAAAAARRTDDLGGALPATEPMPRPAPVHVPPRVASPTPIVPMPLISVTPEPVRAPIAVSPTPIPESRVKTVDFAQAVPDVPDMPRIEPIIEIEVPVEPEAIEPLSESTLDAAVRISRRTPIAVPGFGTPPPPQGGGSLDDYFDRLDAAFASFHPSPPPTPFPDAESIEPVIAPDADTLLAPLRLVAEAASVPADTLRPTPAASPAFGQAFSAFFAAEHGDADAAEVSAFYQTPAVPQVSTDELVDRVTEQVLQRLSDRVVRETVTDIVSRVAERLVRDEIERVRSTIK